MRNNPVLPFFLGACAMSIMLVACDRTLDQAQAADSRASQRAPDNAPTEAATPSAAPMPRAMLADTVITSQVKSSILNDPNLNGADISVNTDRGVVMLTGRVRTPEQIAIASAYAQRQDGVMRVDNHLAVQRE
jgi:hyperosmotically inducible protein